ncbi:MAG: hypothetical protein QMD97_05440 [Candidatus Aenigmarchaeota archaeon]|nr:hypothetical protein [Candidatus Aenigmarchaeota archaeon]
MSIEEINKTANDIQKRLMDREAQEYLAAREHRILVWGDYKPEEKKEQLIKIRDALREEGYPAFLQEDLKGNVEITDRDCSKLLVNGGINIIVKVDGDRIGSGVESELIMCNPELQLRTIFLTNQPFEIICDIKNPHMYYPIYETYTTNEELIIKAIGMVRKETYRRVRVSQNMHRVINRNSNNSNNENEGDKHEQSIL